MNKNPISTYQTQLDNIRLKNSYIRDLRQIPLLNDFLNDFPLKTQRFYKLSTNIHNYLCVKSLIYSLVRMVS